MKVNPLNRGKPWKHFGLCKPTVVGGVLFYCSSVGPYTLRHEEGVACELMAPRACMKLNAQLQLVNLVHWWSESKCIWVWRKYVIYGFRAPLIFLLNVSLPSPLWFVSESLCALCFYMCIMLAVITRVLWAWEMHEWFLSNFYVQRKTDSHDCKQWNHERWSATLYFSICFSHCLDLYSCWSPLLVNDCRLPRALLSRRSLRRQCWGYGVLWFEHFCAHCLRVNRGMEDGIFWGLWTWLGGFRRQYLKIASVAIGCLS